MMKNPMMINGKEVEDYKLHVGGDCGDDSYISWAAFVDGTELSGEELGKFEAEYLADLVWGRR